MKPLFLVITNCHEGTHVCVVGTLLFDSSRNVYAITYC